MRCEFEKVDDSAKPWQCKKCGYRIKVNATRGCTVASEIPSVQMPSLFQKAIHFSSAVSKDLANGMKRCTDEEIERRLSICKECPFYIKKTEESGSCRLCGCPMSRDRVYLNKVAWDSEHCPHNPPKW